MNLLMIPQRLAVGGRRAPSAARPCAERTVHLLSVTILLFTAGCQIPLPQATADPTRHFVLSATGAAAVPAEPGAPVVHLREVELASYLRTQPIVVRRGHNEIEFREYARWGEALEQGIGRVLREELVARGVAGAVLVPGLRSPAVAYDRELKVRVLAAEGGAGGTVNFRAVWELHTGGAKPELVARGDFRPGNLTWNGTDEATFVARLSEAVAGLAAEISAALAKR